MPTNTKPSTPPGQSDSKPQRDKIVVTKVGTVESDKRNKTRTVVVRFKTMHPKYGKFMARKTVLQVHDENNESHVGDTVEVKPCRPLSKTKKWTLVRIVEKSQRVEHIST